MHVERVPYPAASREGVTLIAIRAVECLQVVAFQCRAPWRARNVVDLQLATKLILGKQLERC